MGIVSRTLKQLGTLAAPAKQTLASSQKILAKNALIVGDDLAVKTERSLGIRPDREGDALWKSSLGAMRNRLLIWPAGLGISILFPAAITPALVIGAGYLCYEVAHSLAGAIGKDGDAHHEEAKAAEEMSYEEFEQQKIDSFIRTDFVMAMETTAIGLGQVADLPFVARALSLGVAGMALLVGVSTAVFGLLKLDDVGKYLSEREGDGPFAVAQRVAGRNILRTAPGLMKGLSVVGVGAMLLVGGGILLHNIPALHALSHTIGHAAHGVPVIGGFLEAATPLAVSAVSGLATGFGILAAKPYVKSAYNHTLKPVVNYAKELASKAGNLFSRKKGHEPEPTAKQDSSVQVGIAGEKLSTPEITEVHALNLDEQDIAAETGISVADAMRKAVEPAEIITPVPGSDVTNQGQTLRAQMPA